MYLKWPAAGAEQICGHDLARMKNIDNSLNKNHDLSWQELSIEEICRKGYSEKIVKKILRLLLLSEYKRRQAPPGVKLSIKAFGKARRYPITNLFKI